MICPQCGAPLENGVAKCKYCGEPIGAPVQPQQQIYNQPQPGNQQIPQTYQQPQPQVVYVQQPAYNSGLPDGVDPSWPYRSKLAAGLLGIFLGSLGIHKFYLGKAGWGLIYLIFCWTYIPMILGFIEGIIYFCTDDVTFQRKYHCRLH